MFQLEEGQHRSTGIMVCDDPGAGGAYHHYRVITGGTDTERETLAVIHFQKGPQAENGVNGIFMEDLLQICRHRLQCFQEGDFSCRENALALTKIEEALHWLDHRTKDRQRRHVEGTSEQ